jgi:4-oxalmesaconate hydratase
VFFDTCVYHLPGIELLLRVIPLENILFGSEMVGAVRGIDPRTGQYYDDTKKYVEALGLDDATRLRLFETNAYHVYPRLKAQIGKQLGSQ